MRSSLDAAVDLGEVRALHSVEELRLAAELQVAVLPAVPVSSDLLRAVEHAGGYVGGAFAGGDLVGTLWAVDAREEAGPLHVPVVAVAPAWRGRGLAGRLVAGVRSWAAGAGYPAVAAFVDPTRPAEVGLALRSGARVNGYLIDLLGPGEDRLLARWPSAGQGAPGRPDGDEELIGPVRLSATPSGEPVLHDVPGRRLLVRQPPAQRLQWRAALRSALAGPLTSGWSITTATRSGWYVVEESS